MVHINEIHASDEYSAYSYITFKYQHVNTL